MNIIEQHEITKTHIEDVYKILQYWYNAPRDSQKGFFAKTYSLKKVEQFAKNGNLLICEGIKDNNINQVVTFIIFFSNKEWLAKDPEYWQKVTYYKPIWKQKLKKGYYVLDKFAINPQLANDKQTHQASNKLFMLLLNKAKAENKPLIGEFVPDNKRAHDFCAKFENADLHFAEVIVNNFKWYLHGID